MKVELVKTDSSTEIQLSGELTVMNINEIKKKMVESLCSDTMIKLNHDMVTEVDVTYIQLLKSFCFTADKKNLEVVISDNNTDVLKKVLDATGIHNFVLTESNEE